MTNLLSPFVRVQGREIAAAAITADPTFVVMKAPYALTISAVRYIPVASKSGADTNSRTLNLYNRTTGAGAVLIATLALVSGVDLVDNVAKAIPLSATPANLEVASGDVLEWESLHVGTGITDPGGLLEISYIRAD